MKRVDDDSTLAKVTGPVQPLLALLQRTSVSIGVLAVCFAVGLISLWAQFGDRLTANPRFELTVDKVDITPTPKWIQTDLKAEVFRDGSLGSLSLRDKNLVTDVADAFAVHSWVAEVEQVRKSHGRVRIQLAYRRPVAMVEVFSEGRRGLIPVDAEGTILPTADFSPNDARNYLRVSVPSIRPYGLVGARWDDDRVCHGARIAAAWGDQWRKPALYRILAIMPLSSKQISYELSTKERAQVVWGSPIGEESPGEPGAKRKIANLLRFVEDKGPLDESLQSEKLDLREESVKRLNARTARRIGPG